MLKHLIKRIKEESEKFRLFLNIKKTKLMTTARNGNVKITVDGEEIDCVQEFTFLGSQIDQSGESGPEIKRRVAVGRIAMMSMNRIWKSKDISLTTKCRLAVVILLTTYSCESWTVKKIDRRKIDSFELWCWRRLLRIPWTAKVTNKQVLECIKPDLSLEGKITKLRLTYFGHVMRSNSLEKAIMLGIVSGKRKPGRQRTRWLDIIKADTSQSIKQLQEVAQDRKAWRELAHRIA
ncbi:hypothetical protein JGG83_23145 [Salmonella enterica subsp. enterica serovar Derby]|nr:hypothetical protein [Salmonella enterica subsp. enterica serovar Derby]